MLRPRHLVADALQRAWSWASRAGAIVPGTPAAGRFGRFGPGSFIAWPVNTLLNERYMWIGRDTRIGPHVSLSVGMAPGQAAVCDPALRIGDRCVIGRNSAVVAHLSIELGDDVWLGHDVYVTDQNHGYEDVTRPISEQFQEERPVSIGERAWLGTGVIVLPGARIGRHVTVAAGSVVTRDLPDFSVAAGNPARVLKRFEEGKGWQKVEG